MSMFHTYNFLDTDRCWSDVGLVKGNYWDAFASEQATKSRITGPTLVPQGIFYIVAQQKLSREIRHVRMPRLNDMKVSRF
jgi:hypothetical protein